MKVRFILSALTFCTGEYRHVFFESHHSPSKKLWNLEFTYGFAVHSPPSYSTGDAIGDDDSTESSLQLSSVSFSVVDSTSVLLNSFIELISFTMNVDCSNIYGIT